MEPRCSFQIVEFVPSEGAVSVQGKVTQQLLYELDFTLWNERAEVSWLFWDFSVVPFGASHVNDIEFQTEAGRILDCPRPHCLRGNARNTSGSTDVIVPLSLVKYEPFCFHAGKMADLFLRVKRKQQP